MFFKNEMKPRAFQKNKSRENTQIGSARNIKRKFFRQKKMISDGNLDLDPKEEHQKW